MTFDLDCVRNSFEREVAKTLVANQTEGAYRIEYETEKLPYVIAHDYVPDFILHFPSGHKRYIESKGYFDPQDRRKILAVIATHQIDLRIIFQKNHILRKGARNRYSSWAQRYGVPYAIGTLPIDWLTE